MLDREFYENFGALEKGVILPSCDIEKELSSMTPAEARKAKRKWRKLMRKAKKRTAKSWGTFGDKSFFKRCARRALSEKGRELFEEEEKENK
tara:strand:+ start:2533 stop:2808 length:276 start_codon:yes stop_codon:yes gene_type:complete